MGNSKQGMLRGLNELIYEKHQVQDSVVFNKCWLLLLIWEDIPDNKSTAKRDCKASSPEIFLKL